MQSWAGLRTASSRHDIDVAHSLFMLLFMSNSPHTGEAPRGAEGAASAASSGSGSHWQPGRQNEALILMLILCHCAVPGGGQ